MFHGFLMTASLWSRKGKTSSSRWDTGVETWKYELFLFDFMMTGNVSHVAGAGGRFQPNVRGVEVGRRIL